MGTITGYHYIRYRRELSEESKERNL